MLIEMAVQMGRHLLSTPELGVIISNLQTTRYLIVLPSRWRATGQTKLGLMRLASRFGDNLERLSALRPASFALFASKHVLRYGRPALEPPRQSVWILNASGL
jgi:hypothetical protein